MRTRWAGGALMRSCHFITKAYSLFAIIVLSSDCLTLKKVQYEMSNKVMYNFFEMSGVLLTHWTLDQSFRKRQRVELKSSV